MTDLQRYLEIKRQMRESKDAVLAQNNLTWTKWIALEKSAIEEAQQTMANGVKVRLEGGYYAQLDEKPVRAFKETEAKVIGTNYRVSIHTERE